MLVLSGRSNLGMWYDDTMLSVVSLNFSSIASCSAVTKSASAVAISNALVENLRSRGLIGFRP